MQRPENGKPFWLVRLSACIIILLYLYGTARKPPARSSRLASAAKLLILSLRNQFVYALNFMAVAYWLNGYFSSLALKVP